LFIVLFRFLLGGLSFSKGVKHLLIMLISLEFIVLIVFRVLIVRTYSLNQYIRFIFLIFRVCEGVLGLTLLVVIARRLGGGYFNRFSLIV